jgi:Acyl-coenzyme A:6-aminopenicillanic acid acyl-transferase
MSDSMFTADVPTYLIDLRSIETKRWEEVISCEKTVAGRIVQEAASQFERVPELLRWVFGRLYEGFGGLYQGEIATWAEALGVSLGTATILNCAYELSHMRWPKLFGCTAGVRWIDGLGMVHVRTLDWPLATIGAATRLFRFRSGSREFVAVGVPGHVGVLSGMLPQAYSVTINWAPPAGFPSFDFGPVFLLRDTLETCDSYDAAVRALTETRLSTSVFFTVCGTAKDQACVIERTQHEAVVRPMQGTVLVQANHHIAGRFVKNNEDLLEGAEDEDVFSLPGSSKRADILSRALAEIPVPCTLDRVANALNRATVLNQDTCQQIVFCPVRGEVKVWRRCEG